MKRYPALGQWQSDREWTGSLLGTVQGVDKMLLCLSSTLHADSQIVPLEFQLLVG